MKRLGVLAVVFLTATCFGFGGFDFGASLPQYSGLNARLSELNSYWGGAESLGFRHPWPWVGGHGAGWIGDFTLGGRGAVTGYMARADSMEVQGGGARVFLETGYVWAPIDELWVRPVVELGGDALLFYVHDTGSPFRNPDFSQWYVGWTVGAAPGLEVMGRLRYDLDKYVGLFAKAHYYYPVYGPNWYIDDNPPGFDLEGIHLQAGIRFGRFPPWVMRI